jgi:exopolyphosphatase / guanosine-5'-triphosphate,3'-diphosphate pyrophosphatase
MTRFAILDIGTNTFHLLIIEKKQGSSFDILYKTEQFVKLGEESIMHIGDAAFQRGIVLLKAYKQKIDEYEVKDIFASGTAAIRRADNSGKFIKEVKKQTGIEIKKISGDEEAHYIYLGARWTVELDEHPVLIMDIGGGSTEFIIADKENIYWEQSFPLGASVLLNQFQKTDLISESEIKQLNEFLTNTLQALFEQLKKYPVNKFIGTSGSFDSLAEMVAHQFYTPDILKGKTSSIISKSEFEAIYNKIITSSLEERLHMKGLQTMRAEMIVVAFIAIKFILEKINLSEIYQSEYALKEGVLWSLLHK